MTGIQERCLVTLGGHCVLFNATATFYCDEPTSFHHCFTRISACATLDTHPWRLCSGSLNHQKWPKPEWH
jgi:hypothetical protein